MWVPAESDSVKGTSSSCQGRGTKMQESKHLLPSHFPSGVTAPPEHRHKPRPAPLLSLFALRVPEAKQSGGMAGIIPHGSLSTCP